jgi:hypothetical protein
MKRPADEQRLLDLGLSEIVCDGGVREWFDPHEPDVVQARTDANGRLTPGGRPQAMGLRVTAGTVLQAALAHLGDRAVTYDSPAGERSMGRAVVAFNVLTGHALTEEDGWLLLEVLKIVRGRAAPGYHADSYEDRVSYAALGAEARARAAGGV